MNFGFVSTRFAGTDGVSLESMKWAAVLDRSGHRCHWFSGLNDRPAESARVVPEAHFAHPRITAIDARIWHHDSVDPDLLAEVEDLRRHLGAELDGFVRDFAIDVLIPQNAITIPMHLPLGLALADFIRARDFPTIAHHHDFHWERERFAGAAARPWLDEAFPPSHPSLVHAVIHSGAARDLQERLGLDAVLIPNVMDFASAPPAPARSAAAVREAIGLAEDDRLILQPTRVVPRKGIEHAIDLVHRLADPRNQLVVSHEAGDEGLVYRDQLIALAGEKGVDLRFLDPRAAGSPTLDELYHLADLVTFPSLYEGFGNALLEAVWFRKPVLVNRYPVFKTDIEPCGFDFVVIDGTIDDETVAAAAAILADLSSADAAVEKNHAIAAAHFSYEVVEARLGELLDRLGLSL
jgi:glycosyltransferase involved in cell wall biosynthesis